MKVLLAYPYLPHPDVAHGSGRLLAPLLAHWRDQVDITLVCGYRPHEAQFLDGARSLVRELVAVPRPMKVDLSAVGRVLESARTAFLRVVRRDPIHATKLDRSAFRNAIRAARARTRFSVAQVELAGLARAVEDLDGVPSVLVDHEAGVASGGDVASDPRTLRYLRAIYPRFRAIGALCREDALDLEAAIGGARVFIRRPGVTVPPNASREARASGEGDVLFVGSPEHLPNLDALDWLASDIWPRVRAQAPKARCRFVGGGAPPRIARALAAAGIDARGFVTDLGAELAAAAVVVAPLRIGRGVRMKNLEALAAAAPLVTTTLGARGLDVAAGRDALVLDDAAAFADGVVRLLRDPDLAVRLGASGRDHVARGFAHATAAKINLELWNRLASG